MPGYWLKGRTRCALVQARWRLAGRAAPMLALLLGACADPLAGPLDLFHDLEGGEIAAQRPPPPGAGMPYPKLATVPPKPTLPGQAYRNGLQAQLLAERDRTERLAADAPIAPLPPSPAPALPPPSSAPPSAASASGTAAPVASATLDTVEAPAAAPPAPPPMLAPVLTIAGAPPDASSAPAMPPAPPPPATFEGVSAEPSPTPLVLPAGLVPPPSGTQVFFDPGATVLPPSQSQALKDFLSHRRKQPIEIIGLGEATSDTPDGQAAAIALALRRAQSVAAALRAMRVPPDQMRLSAWAFGRGVVLRLL